MILKNPLFLMFGLILAVASAPIAARADELADQVQPLLAKQSASIVTVKVVIKTQFKMSGQAQDTESRVELQGSVITPDGLIMLSNAPFNSKNLAEMMGMPDSSGFEMKTTPTEFKVVVGNEEKQYSAFLAATDANLNLAFIKIEDLAGRTLQPVDFASPLTPTVGEKVYSVSRLSKGYDYAPYVEGGWVAGQIAKPQQAWIVADGGDIGLPVFTGSGELLGIIANVQSGVKDSDAGGGAMGMGMIMRMFGGGGARTSVFLIPTAVVNTVIALAKQQAVTVGATRAKTAAPAVATPTKPAVPAPPTAPISAK